MHFPPPEILQLVDKILHLLIARDQTIAVSEAACGGLLSSYLVSIPGASRFFDGSTLVYSLKSRLKLSGWSEQDIVNYTGPSELVVLRLARNLRIELGSTYVLSESGFAGPSTNIGGVTDSIQFDNTEVGTVYVAISGPNGEVSKKVVTQTEDRAQNMQEFAKIGLEFLLEVLQKEDE
ncbi:hypothetical protein BABINDRAFT_100771 [Babjeviella inositovora NRRL Y-12698]|uniref:CinA C-terminal domain-containing protein n=1 Tax=Babjeviella inositovora NRRL Y-12698 TaxID=984486 RepID=A0A1E3QJX5_9ASCO|nr:uncharacterized protein BABINDRAFT_100771 [Babjeviella inositovora NRRL Y-12698]ODQ77382.1 hypothetical protein BABINDRAFT_100771 [Babjeviella inositovora NRRL Y-12698]